MRTTIIVWLAVLLALLPAGCSSKLVEVTVCSDVAEAVLSIDNEEVGVLPQTVRLKPGTYDMVVEPPEWWQGILPLYEQTLNVSEDGEIEIEVTFFRSGRKVSLQAGSNPSWTETALWFDKNGTLVSVSTEGFTLREYEIGEAVDWLWTSADYVVVRTETGRYIKLDPGSGKQEELVYDQLLPGRYGIHMLALKGDNLYLIGRDDNILLTEGNPAHAVLDITGQYLLYVNPETRELVLMDVTDNATVVVGTVGSIDDLQFSPTGKYVTWLDGNTRHFRRTDDPSVDDWAGWTVSGEGIESASFLWVTKEEEQAKWEGYILSSMVYGEVYTIFGGDSAQRGSFWHQPHEWQLVGEYVYALEMDNEEHGTLKRWFAPQNHNGLMGIGSGREKVIANAVVPGSWQGSRCGQFLAYISDGELVIYVNRQ